jgi:hypothetical protein
VVEEENAEEAEGAEVSQRRDRQLQVSPLRVTKNKGVTLRSR